jgi:hypothetical protein
MNLQAVVPVSEWRMPDNPDRHGGPLFRGTQVCGSRGARSTGTLYPAGR